MRGAEHLEKLLTAHSGGAGAQVALPSLPSHTEFKARVPDEQRARYAPSDDPRESAAALHRSQRDLVGDPTLELFTEGSRVMRARYPVAPYEEILRADATERSEPLELQVRGDRAFLDSRNPARDFVPILLVREGGLWRVDLVETFKSFFFDGEGAYWLVNLASPYAGFTRAVLNRSEDLSPLDLGDRIDRVGDCAARALATARAIASGSAEILMRNCFVSAEAIPLYAEAARLAPQRCEDRAHVRRPRELSVHVEDRDRRGRRSRPRLLHEPRLAVRERARARAQAREFYRKALDRNPRDDYARAALERLASDDG